MRGALVTRIPFWPTTAAVLSLGVAYGLASSAQMAALAFVVTVTVALALVLPPHLFVAASLAVLGTLQLSAEHASFAVGGISVHTNDLLLVLVASRALAPRPRRSVNWRIFDASTAGAALAWALVMIAAAARGYAAGTPTDSLIRLDEQVFYYPLFAWGCVRVLREPGVSSTRVAKALAVTVLAFVCYAALERITHQHFGDPSTKHVGVVFTAQGLTLHRDYGLYAAIEIYGLAALAALAHLLF